MTTASAHHQIRINPGLLVTILLTSFVAVTYGFGFYLFSAIISDMRADLNFSYAAVGVITACGQIGFLLFALGGAWLSPRIGGGKVVIGSIILCGACLTLISVSSNIHIICFYLTILGGCAASVYVPMVELVSRVIAYEHRGKVLGLVSSGTSYGVFINSLLVPVFILNNNWRGIWMSVGTGTLALSIISIVVFHKLGMLGKSDTNETISDTVPAESDSAPVAFRQILVPRVVIIWALTFLNGFSTLPFQNYLSPYLREELGFSVVTASHVWSIIGTIGMGAGFIVGWISDRTGVRIALVGTYLCIFMASLILLNPLNHYLLLSAGVLFAVAFYPIFGLIPAYIAKTSEGVVSTYIFAVANVTLGMGGIVGNFLGGWSQTQTETFTWIYIVIAGCAILSATLTITLPKENKREEKSELAREMQ